MCGPSYLPHGVPISTEVHEKYSAELKEAWEVFDAWWHNDAEFGPDNLVDASTMPSNVKDAWKLIKETPIPFGTDDDPLGAESCYAVGVQGYLKNDTTLEKA